MTAKATVACFAIFLHEGAVSGFGEGASSSAGPHCRRCFTTTLPEPLQCQENVRARKHEYVPSIGALEHELITSQLQASLVPRRL